MSFDAFLDNLFRYPPIAGVTINCVSATPALQTAIVVVVAVAFAAAFIAAQLNGRPLLAALRTAALAAFFAGGLAYSLHADLGWSGWVRTDHRAFSGRTTDEKLRAMEGPFYDFVLKARTSLRGDYMMPNDNSDNYFTRRFEYFLLPLRKRADAPYLVALADREAAFDQRTRTYTRRDLTIRDAEPVLLFMSDAYILKRPAAAAR